MFPNTGFSASVAKPVSPQIKKTPPKDATKTPASLPISISPLAIIANKIKKSGEVKVNREALIGVVSAKPPKNKILLIVIPNKEQAANKNKSRLSTFSRTLMNCTVPNINAAKIARNKVNSKGEI